MSVSSSVGSRRSVKADALVIFMQQDEKPFASAARKLGAEIPLLKPLFKAKDFVGKKSSTTLAYTGGAVGSARVILAGLGNASDITLETIRRAAASAAKRAGQSHANHIALELPTIEGFEVEAVAQAIAEGASLSQYKYDKFKTIGDTTANGLVKKFTIFSTDKTLGKQIEAGVSTAGSLIGGVVLARDLANAANNEVYPEVLGQRAADAGKKAGFKVTILDKKKIESLRMGGLLGVNSGSVRPPVFIVMEYNGGPKNEAPIVLVGKGITFDTGGISIKPAAGMSDMKSDMHGAATVIGAMYSIASLGLKRNVVALVPSTENMPSGTAMVPGDILTFMNGKTAEIDNTDAEGRLILADALCYADRYKPLTVIDVATLTGACVVALGTVTTGMMGTDANTMNRLRDSAKNTNEYVCELPLYEEYEELISSDYADIKNSGGRYAGAITAGLFLKHFVTYPWVHLDIAGTGIAPKPTSYSPKGATGVGVRLLTDMVMNWKS
ncbi:MAG: leucyl aminopeptidase [bacterium]|nr:leucyl aminopeptidase [bacterium]